MVFFRSLHETLGWPSEWLSTKSRHQEKEVVCHENALSSGGWEQVWSWYPDPEQSAASLARAGFWVEVAFNRWHIWKQGSSGWIFFFNDSVLFSWQLSLWVEQRAATFITCRSKEEGEKCSDLVQILPGSRGEPDEFVVYWAGLPDRYEILRVNCVGISLERQLFPPFFPPFSLSVCSH